MHFKFQLFFLLVFTMLFTCASSQIIKESNEISLEDAYNNLQTSKQKFQKFMTLYNKATSHSNADVLYNKKYIMDLIESSMSLCKSALSTFELYRKTIDERNKKALDTNTKNAQFLLKNLTAMKTKMEKFYAAPKGRQLQALR